MKYVRVRLNEVVLDPGKPKADLAMQNVFEASRYGLEDTGNGVLIAGEHGQVWVPNSQVRWAEVEAEVVKAASAKRSKT